MRARAHIQIHPPPPPQLTHSTNTHTHPTTPPHTHTHHNTLTHTLTHTHASTSLRSSTQMQQLINDRFSQKNHSSKLSLSSHPPLRGSSCLYLSLSPSLQWRFWFPICSLLLLIAAFITRCFPPHNGLTTILSHVILSDCGLLMRFCNVYPSGVLTALFGCCVLPCTSLQCHFMQRRT